MKKIFILISSAIFIAGCSSSFKVHYELPVEFRNPVKKTEFITRYSPSLSGKKIFIDPGHGGQDRRSRGPAELAVEADINLNVALHLKYFLTEAGAYVILSRIKDTTVDLKERSYMANRSGADIFISIHHNAPPTPDDNWTNYTSTYYHAFETDTVYEPCERDLARYIQRDISYAMRNPGGPGSFDGTYSDYNIYPGQGFSVLRVTKIPAVLVECGFFSNPYEEQRLAIDEFNKIEAWGIFRGIARYFSAGIPEIKYLDADSVAAGDSILLHFKISDSSGVDVQSVKVEVDSATVENFSVNSAGLVLLQLDAARQGVHTIRIIAANKNKNHSFPYYKEITIF